MNRIAAGAFFLLISFGIAACSGGGCGGQEEATTVKCGSGTRLSSDGTMCLKNDKAARF